MIRDIGRCISLGAMPLAMESIACASPAGRKRVSQSLHSFTRSVIQRKCSKICTIGNRYGGRRRKPHGRSSVAAEHIRFELTTVLIEQAATSLTTGRALRRSPRQDPDALAGSTQTSVSSSALPAMPKCTSSSDLSSRDPL